MNIMQIMKQAQNVQAKLKASQEELAKMELVGEAGGGAVKVTNDGQGKFKSIKLDASALNISADVAEELEDLMNNWLSKHKNVTVVPSTDTLLTSLSDIS